MKMRTLLGFVLTVISLALGLSACVWAKGAATRNVVIGKDLIVIPGTGIAKADQRAMNKILSKYDKSLFRFHTYENGKLKKAQGTLTDVVTDRKLASEIAANVQIQGFADTTMQAYNPQKTSNLPLPPGPTVKARQNALEMMEQLKPILKPYTRGNR